MRRVAFTPVELPVAISIIVFLTALLGAHFVGQERCFMVASKRRCKDCEFYCEEGQGEDKSQCRFNAPFPSLKSAMMSEKFFSEASITWPTVQPTDWCGHFSPANP